MINLNSGFGQKIKLNQRNKVVVKSFASDSIYPSLRFNVIPYQRTLDNMTYIKWCTFDICFFKKHTIWQFGFVFLICLLRMHTIVFWCPVIYLVCVHIICPIPEIVAIENKEIFAVFGFS